MSLASSLEDFSLAELFRMVDQGRKSGLLTLCRILTSPESTVETYHYIWFRQGRVVAVADRLDGKGLMAQISQRGWLSQRVIERLNSLAAVEAPLGITLKTQGALQAEQVNLLFKHQIQQIWSLFETQTGRFELNGKAPLPTTEMTGLSIPAIEVALVGLRAVKNWQRFATALPAPSSIIKKVASSKLQLRLNTLEANILEFAQDSNSLNRISQKLNQPIDKIQQATFRLIVTGLLEEIPQDASRKEIQRPNDHPSILQNFIDFLRS